MSPTQSVSATRVLLLLALLALYAATSANADCSSDSSCRATQFCHFGNCVAKRGNNRGCDLINGDRQCRSGVCELIRKPFRDDPLDSRK